VIHCDNKQTIRLVTEDVAKLQTKLRHVDIHNHWLRQEVSRGKIMVAYISTENMLADGLTKSLPANKWENFLNQLGLVERNQPVLKNVRLEEVQAQIETLSVGEITK
jgi:hypothetical protein